MEGAEGAWDVGAHPEEGGGSSSLGLVGEGIKRWGIEGIRIGTNL